MGADATFVARSVDRDPKHLQSMLLRAQAHHGSSFLEIYQNCNIFNDGAFEAFTDKKTKDDNILVLEQGEPLVFGSEVKKGVVLDSLHPKVVELGEHWSPNDCWIHDEQDLTKALILTRFFNDPRHGLHLPRPFGVFFQADRPTYEDQLSAQLDVAKERFGEGDLDKLIAGKKTWTVL